MTKKQLWVRDSLLLTVKFLSFFKLSGKSINQISEIIPLFALKSKTISFNNDRLSYILNKLISEDNLNYKISEGILIDYENGSALIKPFKRGDGLTILAESSKEEFATEICNDISEIIEKFK